MARTPSAAADAPVLDDTVEVPAAGSATPSRWRGALRSALRMPAFLKAFLWPRISLPAIALPKKTILVIALGTLGIGGAGAAAYALWPAEPEWPRTPVVKKAKRTKLAASSARAAPAEASREAGSAAARTAANEDAPSNASSERASSEHADTSVASKPVPSHGALSSASPSTSASGPEQSMDKLRRRLGEVMGGGTLLSDGPGELRITARRGASAPAGGVATAPKAMPADMQAAHARVTAAEPATAVQSHPTATAAAASMQARHSEHASSGSHASWSYEGPTGPQSWARLKPEYATCGAGTRQSPIDLRDGIQVQLSPVKFEYQASRFGVIDNGHTVQVNVAPGNFIEVMGRRFELLQFHFHRPSEERIDGRQFDMVAHLVHKDADGRLAVVAVLLERGSAQAVVQAVWNNLPLEKGEEQAAQVSLDPTQLLPVDRSYFTYMGSLTTPPCSEGVLWMVMKKPVPISAEQLSIFARLYPMNARPVQSAMGRMVKESE